MGKIYTKSNLETLTFQSKRLLLLQGPIGSFFKDFSQWLTDKHAKTVFKLNFNYGDEYFYPEDIPNTFAYRDTYQAFPDKLAAFIAEHEIDTIVCFGDARPYHQIAKQTAAAQGLDFWAFEEGYFRPFYITLEKSGVNAFSPLPRCATFFQKQLSSLPQTVYQEPPVIKGGFVPMAKCAMRYYWAANRRSKSYPHYIHHRMMDIPVYIRSWALSGIKRLLYVLKDYKFARAVKNGRYGKFYILPLQVFNDSQVRVHSDFSSVRSFLLHVLTSFATHAPEDTNLIVKHHPMDRGFTNYRKDIQQLIKKHPELKKRIFYVHDTSLPTLLRHGIGMVTLNSTSGLSALIHNMPVKVLGRCSYDIAGITYQNSLAQFWKQPTPPNPELFHAYRMYHLNVTQIHGNFYSKVSLPEIANEKHIAIHPIEVGNSYMAAYHCSSIHSPLIPNHSLQNSNYIPVSARYSLNNHNSK
ncbi:capsule biosynthesis protein [Neisseria zalophi]|uniref:Capsule biosynthesis protein n=1 Tax=Neisseria zalophi TaxID=640030 RepID=A0A5J6PSD8_9NEIS|nr:capsule biosynthesis protein [Neisseria zalophi]QEY25641.1 capsule biosynthesis protein [Neisseria zalophi]